MTADRGCARVLHDVGPELFRGEAHGAQDAGAGVGHLALEVVGETVGDTARGAQVADRLERHDGRRGAAAEPDRPPSGGPCRVQAGEQGVLGRRSPSRDFHLDLVRPELRQDAAPCRKRCGSEGLGRGDVHAGRTQPAAGSTCWLLDQSAPRPGRPGVART